MEVRPENVRLQQCPDDPSRVELVLGREDDGPIRIGVHKADFLSLCASFLEDFSEEVRPFLQSE